MSYHYYYHIYYYYFVYEAHYHYYYIELQYYYYSNIIIIFLVHKYIQLFTFESSPPRQSVSVDIGYMLYYHDNYSWLGI